MHAANRLFPIFYNFHGVHTDGQTDMSSSISASDPDQEYINHIGLETFFSTCYILSDVSSIPFYSSYIFQ